MPKSLLIVHYSLYTGGAERSLINFLNALPLERYRVDLLLLRREGAFLGKLPPNVRLVDPSDAPKDIFYNPKSVLPADGGLKGAFYKAVKWFGSALGAALAKSRGNKARQIRWRLVYRFVIPRVKETYDAAFAYMHGEPTYFVADKVSAKRKIAFVHNDYAKTGNDAKLDSPYYERMDAIVTISPTCVEIFKKAFPALESRVFCLPNLISSASVRALADEFVPTEYDAGVPIILSVGRLNVQKAYDLSAEAAAILKSQGRDFRWYVIGDGDEQESLAKSISEKGLEGFFKLLGTRPNPYPYIKHCDIFVQNSRYEGKSVVLDEAKILCRPILVTDYSTARDQIRDGVDGIVVPIDAVDVAQGIGKLLDDHELRRALTERLKSEDFGNVDCINDYMRVIDG